VRRARARVHGRVQGVFFRAETRSRAQSLGLAGSVRNLPDGTVEVVAEGEDDRVGSLVDWLGRGPAGAQVERVEVVEEQPVGESGFQVR
jgi:acylphosphatase